MGKSSKNQDPTSKRSQFIQPLSLGKRNWESYIKEFLMLFLAIVLGFFVENLRESYVEQQSAKVLTQSMLEDLKQDRKALKEAISFAEEKDLVIENFLQMLHTPKESWDTVAIYKSMTTVFTTFPFSPTDGTYSQMKSSGTLRYFNQTLVNQMNAYDNQLKKTVFRDEIVEKAEWELVPLAGTLINFEVTGELRFNKPITKEMYLKIPDKNTLDILINNVAVVRTMMGRSLQEYKSQLALAEDLITKLESR
ncbi:hypothetical protein V8V91_14330 [Algoriphagus halophilus]|uniref:hypothetical protein n=1 Tax=Algoriphagus halophilus TaxID=226505 RepID=UPI00358E560B